MQVTMGTILTSVPRVACEFVFLLRMSVSGVIWEGTTISHQRASAESDMIVVWSIPFPGTWFIKKNNKLRFNPLRVSWILENSWLENTGNHHVFFCPCFFPIGFRRVFSAWQGTQCLFLRCHSQRIWEGRRWVALLWGMEVWIVAFCMK